MFPVASGMKRDGLSAHGRDAHATFAIRKQPDGSLQRAVVNLICDPLLGESLCGSQSSAGFKAIGGVLMDHSRVRSFVCSGGKSAQFKSNLSLVSGCHGSGDGLTGGLDAGLDRLVTGGALDGLTGAFFSRLDIGHEVSKLGKGSAMLNRFLGLSTRLGE